MAAERGMAIASWFGSSLLSNQQRHKHWGGRGLPEAPVGRLGIRGADAPGASAFAASQFRRPPLRWAGYPWHSRPFGGAHGPGTGHKDIGNASQGLAGAATSLKPTRKRAVDTAASCAETGWSWRGDRLSRIVRRTEAAMTHAASPGGRRRRPCTFWVQAGLGGVAPVMP
jgi:hypothetical protein